MGARFVCSYDTEYKIYRVTNAAGAEDLCANKNKGKEERAKGLSGPPNHQTRVKIRGSLANNHATQDDVL